MITIDKELFQWEKNRYVFIVNSEATFVQFYNKNSFEAKVVPISNNKAKIPNYLLSEGLPITAAVCTGESSGDLKVITRREFKVLKKPRPEGYYDEDFTGYEIVYDGGLEV